MLKGQPTIAPALTPSEGESPCRFSQIGTYGFSRLADRRESVGGHRRRLGRQPIGVERHQTGPFMDGTQPTGRTVTYPVASFAQIEGDRIGSDHVYLDPVGGR
jgi:hypothetical protein